MVISDLQGTGKVAQSYWIPGQPINVTTPFPVQTDGRQALFLLKTQFSLFNW